MILTLKKSLCSLLCIKTYLQETCGPSGIEKVIYMRPIIPIDIGEVIFMNTLISMVLFPKQKDLISHN